MLGSHWSISKTSLPAQSLQIILDLHQDVERDCSQPAVLGPNLSHLVCSCLGGTHSTQEDSPVHQPHTGFKIRGRMCMTLTFSAEWEVPWEQQKTWILPTINAVCLNLAVTKSPLSGSVNSCFRGRRGILSDSSTALSEVNVDCR